jgi:hypothetical protein
MRSMQDRFVAVPGGPAAAAPAQGPIVPGVAVQDRFGTAPKEQPTGDNWQQVPGGPARAPGRTRPPAEGRPLDEPRVETPVEPPPPPVPTAEAQLQITETAKEVQARVEETLGTADQQWVQMDFPARVIRLKMENDKVRTKLDKLEVMARQPLA